MNAQLVADLKAARQHLALHGWYQGWFWRLPREWRTCPTCAAGAVRTVLHLGPDVDEWGDAYHDAETRRMKACYKALAAASGFSSVVFFNDAHATTLADVLAVFNRAIVVAEGSDGTS